VFESDIHHFHDSKYFDQHQLAVICLSRVFENPWFTRAWIAQEVGLASQATIVLGEAELDLRSSVKTTVLMSSALKLPAYFESGHFAEFLVMVHMWTEPEGFVQVLRLGMPFFAQDDRDKVYAYLAHPKALRSIEGWNRMTVQPDHTKLATEVYQQVTTRLIECDRSLEVLSTDLHDRIGNFHACRRGCHNGTGTIRYPQFWETLTSASTHLEILFTRPHCHRDPSQLRFPTQRTY
jgi:hypothetical protein